MLNPDFRSKFFTLLSVVISIAIHIGLVWVLSLQIPEEKPRVAKRPDVIKATVLDRKQLIFPEDKRRIAEQKKRDERKRLERLKQEKSKKEKRRKEKEAQEKKRQEKLKKEADAKKALERQQKEQKKKAQEKTKKEAERQEEAKRIEGERRQEELLEQEQLQRALEAEQARKAQESKDEAQAMSYMGLIKQLVENNWSRPPSARNGMEVLLEIHLLPNGRIVQVDVVQSSGNSAFDRSAVIAVEKTEQIPELSELPNRVFERYYRRFRLLFKPEDLRL